MVPVFVKKIATVSPLSVSNSYFVPTPGRVSERRDIADIREMILKYITPPLAHFYKKFSSSPLHYSPDKSDFRYEF
jgi:hypothetical protein